MNTIIWNRFFSPITFIESKLNELHDGYFYYRKVTPSTIIDSDKEIRISYKTNFKTTNPEIDKIDEIDETATVLNEVIVYGKRTAYQLINKVIESFEKNYPDNPFSSLMKTNIQSKVSDST